MHNHRPESELDDEFCLEKAPLYRELWEFLGDGDLREGYEAWKNQDTPEWVLTNAEFIFQSLVEST